MKYLKISVHTTTEFSDIVASVLMEHGSDGVSIKDHSDVLQLLKSPLNWDYADESILKTEFHGALVFGYFNETANANKIREAVSALKNDPYFDTGSLEVLSSYEDSADWENVWKQFFKPITVKKITIVPAWLKHKQKNTVPVYIDPGLAFGTGSHETTALCIELMQQIQLAGKHVADIGCGSGILGISALKLGASRCTMLDIDPCAVRASQENAEFNGVFNLCTFIEGGFSKTENLQLDVIVANLTADLLVEFCSYAEKMLHSGGVLIVSGILDGYLPQVQKAFCANFTTLKTQQRGDWHGLLLIKNG
ncbi:MAG: 50S ribosomal protein L11 methyltransferase [Firmicutes bacterium]|nr:50S ribosomal protein L11 methyltransferase [Bacillota bacterium]